MGDWLAEVPKQDLAALRLAGRTVVVTGAGSSGAGIGNGRASAILMARHGARVALLDQNRAAADETLAAIEREGGAATALTCDVSLPSSCRDAVEAVMRAFGRIDVLMNNVGILGPAGTAVEVDPDAWDLGMAINVKSMVLMARCCIPHMARRRSGSIINVASIAGIQGGHPDLLYPTTKGAIVQMTRAMAAQHGADGIRVNCIAPGMVYTPMVAGGMTAEMRERRRLQTLLQTEGTAWDVAMAALFLASDDARWITGIVLPVDGGVTAGAPAARSDYASTAI
jgi:NAD(P)-dependent dehydrogenase (short-subunit alcohol dehydrogenase family)